MVPHHHWLLALLVVLPRFAGAQSNDTADLRFDSGPPQSCPDCVPVFFPGLNGSNCFRIPSIIRTHAGTLLAFIENRPDSCADDSAHHHILMVRRSIDGKNWKDLTIVKIGVPPCSGCPPAISNPNPVEVKKPDGSYAILIHFDTMNNPSVARHGLDMQMWSYDDGKTWVQESEINFPPEKNVGQLIGPSTGIQSADGTIYFCNTEGFLYSSKDYGKTWNASARSKAAGECSIAFAQLGGQGSTIVETFRTGTKRSIVIWNDLVPSEPFQPAALEGANCQGSILNLGGALYISSVGTASDFGRAHMGIKKSIDGGQTWGYFKKVWDGPSGYGQLVDLGHPSKLGLLFEAGTKHYTDTISFVVVDVSSSDNTEKLDAAKSEVYV